MNITFLGCLNDNMLGTECLKCYFSKLHNDENAIICATFRRFSKKKKSLDAQIRQNVISKNMLIVLFFQYLMFFKINPMFHENRE